MSKSLIEEAVKASAVQYFRDLASSQPHDLYDVMLPAFEKPLLQVVMSHAEGNQSKAAQWLGLNRNTLRKKLSEHGLL